jgi:cytochrome c peroxidase
MVSLRFRKSIAFAALLAVAGLNSDALSQADVPMPNPPEFPDENPLLPDQDTLGKFLFWDEQLGGDNTMACGTCHIHEAGGSDPRAFNTPHPGPDGLFNTDDDIAGSQGVVRIDKTNVFVDGGLFGHNPQVTGRKSPTTLNAVYFNDVFWDGRATQAYTDPQTGLVEIPFLAALESQAVGPPLSDVEMSTVGRDWNDITAKLALVKPGRLMINMPAEMVDFLNDNANYPAMFDAVYGDPAITSLRVAMAIANYERVLISDETVLDDMLKGFIPTMPVGPLLDGFNLFQGDANCASCHTLPFTMDNDYHNIGVRPDAEDIGREGFTGDPADKAKFKTPNIRNSKLRLPLFHNGGKATVREVIEFYDLGGDFIGPNIDADLVPLNLTSDEIDALVALVEDGMTDQRVIDNTFPFTRPMLTSEFPSLNSTYGVVSGAGDVLGHLPAFPGNVDYTMGVANATANVPAVVLLSFLPDPAGTVFPDPRFPVPVNLDLNTLILDAVTVTDNDGYASINLSITDNPILSGLKFYSQWFIFDAAALATGGVYGTEGLEVEIL